MTDRIHALTVALEQPIRDDDVEPILNAIRMIRGVQAVTTHAVDLDAFMAIEKAKRHARPGPGSAARGIHAQHECGLIVDLRRKVFRSDQLDRLAW